MTRPFVGGLLAFCLTISPVFANPVPCHAGVCQPADFALSSLSPQARYGLLIESPVDLGCAAVQFVITDHRGGIVGRSHALGPGAVQVVRIGQGFQAGAHPLRIVASGCPARPAVVRRVRLGKASPDHGWRASAVVQVQYRR
jgi:hypothetical protein